MFQLITQKAEEFIGAVNLQTQPGTNDMTATQVLELQRQAVKMLGQSVLGVMRMKRDATYLRLYTILDEYMRPVGKTVRTDENGQEQIVDRYRSFEVENSKNRDGETVKRFIQIVNRNLSEEELRGVYEHEKELSQQEGKPVRYSFLNLNVLESIPMEFKVVVTTASRDSSSLDKILFQDRLAHAIEVANATQRPINGDKLIEDYEKTWETRGMFSDTPFVPGMGIPAMAGGGEAESMLANLNQMGNGGTQPGQGMGPAPSQASRGQRASMSAAIRRPR